MLMKKWRQEATFDVINVLLAVYLVLSPWIFSFTDAVAASRNAWISGIVIGLASIASILRYLEWEEWVSLVFGLWVAISPWILGFHSTIAPAMRTDLAVGIAVALFAATELWMMRHRPPTVTV